MKFKVSDMYLSDSSDSYVLVVGLTEFRDELDSIFSKLLCVDTGFEAIQQLRREVPTALVAPWNLTDMPNGMLFKRILAGRSSISSVALVDSFDSKQEIAARSLGITVVVDNNISPADLGELINHLSDAQSATGS
jgi:DNA-binding NarL/FixJ family response regulator